MKKAISTSLLLSFLYLSLQAQLVVFPDTFTYSGMLVDQNDHEEINGSVTNAGSTTDTVCWYVRVLNHPSGWEMSVCDINNCYIIYNTSTQPYTFVAQPGVDNLFYFGVTPYCTAGNADMELVMWLKSDSAGTVTHPKFFADYSGNCVSSVRESVANRVKVFPTTFQSRLTLEGADVAGVSSLKMYNAIGNLVKEIKHIHSANVVIETGQLSSGVYILRMETPDGVLTRRVVKE